jgi:hypothetical protein
MTYMQRGDRLQRHHSQPGSSTTDVPFCIVRPDVDTIVRCCRSVSQCGAAPTTCVEPPIGLLVRGRVRSSGTDCRTRGLARDGHLRPVRCLRRRPLSAEP